jgi:hypothetical protein
MPLLSDKDIHIGQLSLDDIYLLPSIIEKSNLFNLNELITLKDNNKVLYINQGEIATNVITNNGLYDVIGSDDATTCLLLFAKSNISNKLLCAHIDSSKKSNVINLLIDEIGSTDNLDKEYIDIYIIGGLNDELSNDITKSKSNRKNCI